MLEKTISWSRRKEEEGEPAIRFGRYSDNNKPVEKVDKWNEAEALFKEKSYHKSVASFFEYLTDEYAGNVTHQPEEKSGSFSFYQGSKIIRGSYDEKS